MRLPETAFKKNAGTEVVTDVLFLQKKAAEEAGATPAWVQVVQLNKAGHDPEAEAEWSVNGLYREHPIGSWAGRTIRAACTAPGATRFNSKASPAPKA